MKYDPEEYLEVAQRLANRPPDVYALDAEYELAPDTVDGESQMKKPGAWVRCWMYVTDDQVDAEQDRKYHASQEWRGR